MANNNAKPKRIVTSRKRYLKENAKRGEYAGPVVEVTNAIDVDADQAEWASFFAAAGSTRARLLKEGA